LDQLFPLGAGPTLLPPNAKLNNSAAFFKATSQATLYFGQTLDATITAQQKQQKNFSQAAAVEAFLVGQQIAALQNQIKIGKAQAQTQVTNLQTSINTANSQTQGQQSSIA